MSPTEILELQFNRACISDDDTNEAYQYLEAIFDNQPHIVQQGLLIAAIVAYSRPFVNSDGKGATSRVSLKISKELSESESALHDKVIGLRNRLAAHSDYEMRPIKRLAGAKSGFGITFVPMRQVLEGFDHNAFRELAYRTMILCKKKAHELDGKIREHAS